MLQSLLASSFGGGTITPPSGGIIGVPQVPGIPIPPPLQARPAWQALIPPPGQQG
jgi:hypothetical protein